jgi:hypothetical protein
MSGRTFEQLFNDFWLILRQLLQAFDDWNARSQRKEVRMRARRTSALERPGIRMNRMRHVVS